MEVSLAQPASTAGAPAVMVEIVNGEYRCHPCVAVCNNRQMLEAHVAGKKHTAKIALCGGASAFQPATDLPDLPPRESQTLTPAGKKRKNLSAQGSFNCDVCEIDFPSAFPYESHMQGKKHLNKVQKRELGDAPTTVSCEICSISTPDKNAYENHVNGKKHLAKVAKIEKGEAGTFNCEFCNITVQNQAIFETHRNGKKHADKVRKIAEGGSAEGGSAPKATFPCDVCNVNLTSQIVLDAHVAGKKHQKMVSDGAKPKDAPPPQFKCDICLVTATSQELLDLHLQGKKHLKKTSGGGGDGGATNGATPEKKPKLPKAKDVDPALFFCEICDMQMNGPVMMESHKAGKGHAKKAAAFNQQAASDLATSFVKSVREQTENNGTLIAEQLEVKTDAPAQSQQAAPAPEQPAAPIPAHATAPAVAASPGRSRTRRAN